MKRAMRIMLATFFLLLAFAAAAIVTSGRARADENGFRWERPDANPYAMSLKGAMRTRESAFHTLGFSATVVKQLLLATKKPGEDVLITTGDHFLVMAMGGGVIEHDVIVAFSRPLPAKRWQVFSEGRTISVFLFQDYFNWGIRLTMHGVSAMACSASSVGYI